MTPDEKELYGKIKKEEKAIHSKQQTDVSSRKQITSVLEFKNVAFSKENGDQLWFFRTHVAPGKIRNVEIKLIEGVYCAVC